MRRLKWAMVMVVLLAFLMAPVASAAPSRWQSCGYWYQVHWGDTLNAIARRTGVSVWAIMQANGLANPNTLYAGQWLWIPCTAPPPPPPPRHRVCGYWYPVRFGQTLSGIAARTGVSAYAIAAANGLANWSLIYAGTSLWIPCPAYAPVPVPYTPYQPMPTPY